MNKFLTTLSVILSSFALAGCSHVSKVKTVDKFATIEVQGKSSKNKVYSGEIMIVSDTTAAMFMAT